MAFFGRKSPLDALVMPGIVKYNQFRQRRREAQSKKVTERELTALHHKIVSYSLILEVRFSELLLLFYDQLTQKLAINRISYSQFCKVVFKSESKNINSVRLSSKREQIFYYKRMIALQLASF
jgi:hypothetical protein